MVEKHADEFLPPTVEGRVPDAEEMELKASNGSYYMENVWKIQREFPSANVYGPCATDVENLATALRADASVHGFAVEDSSDRLNDPVHCIQMAVAWLQIVHDARNNNTVHVVRRTPHNSGVMLMLQRQEHLRGMCTEMAPVSFILLVRDQQILFTRDRVLAQADTERIVAQMIKSAPQAEAEPETGSEVCRVPNMSPALFKQQITTMNELMKNISERECGAYEPGDVAEVTDVTDVADAMSAVSLSVTTCEDGVNVAVHSARK